MIYGSDQTLMRPAQGRQVQRAGSIQRPQTFAAMRDAGVARPPQPPAPAPAQAPIDPAARAAASAAVANPSAYAQPDVQAQFTRLNRALEEQFGIQRQRLNETMAGRGLYDSNVAVGQLGDLSVQQARAQAGMASDLAQAAAERFAADRSAALRDSLAISQLDEGTRQFDVQQSLARMLGLGELDLRRDQFGEGQRQFDTSVGLDRERLAQQDRQFGQGQQLQRDQLLQQLAMFFGLPAGFDLGAGTQADLMPSGTAAMAGGGDLADGFTYTTGRLQPRGLEYML